MCRKVKPTIKVSVFLIVCSWASLLASACFGDRGPSITYVNRTSVAILINVDIVPKDFSGLYTPRPEIVNEGPIGSGQSKRFVYFWMSLNRDGGERYKYAVTAMRQKDGAIVYQRVFT